MCGIAGYVGSRNATEVLLYSLKKLEYRGYDSAGIAIISKEKSEGGNYRSQLIVRKVKGRIEELEKEAKTITGTVGIGHTRWATHGRPSKENAHPHQGCKIKFTVVHNGILENFRALKAELIAKGHHFISETDTEIIPHLLEEEYKGNMLDAIIRFSGKVSGAYAIALLSPDEPDTIYCIRNQNPLIIGFGDGENFVASDIPALLKFTEKVYYMKDNQIAVIKKNSVAVFALDGKRIEIVPDTVSWSIDDAEKGGYEHFMLKEIHEQTKAINDSLLGRITDLDINGFNYRRIKAIRMVACGTSYHAGLVGRYFFERLAGLQASVEIASEARYAKVLDPSTLTIGISQSGETADTLAALRLAKNNGCPTIAITNSAGSSITFEADQYLLTRAGPEIGVAATKTFTTQVLLLLLLGLYIGKNRGVLNPDTLLYYQKELKKLPRGVQFVLDSSSKIYDVAKYLSKFNSILFIGRGLSYPVALEGALKMKEISYIHAEGYPAGELKHGPLALLQPDMPVVALAPQDYTYEKMLGNIGEVLARESPVIVVTTEGNSEITQMSDRIIYLNMIDPLLLPIPMAVALQLLSYYTALERGCEIDKPRHLAKSVTVE